MTVAVMSYCFVTGVLDGTTEINHRLLQRCQLVDLGINAIKADDGVDHGFDVGFESSLDIRKESVPDVLDREVV